MAQKGSSTAMWMILQQNLAAQISDKRTDVRNGAVHTIWRTLRNRGDQLTNAVWRTSIRSVVFNMLAIDIRRQELVASTRDSVDPSELCNINGTSNIIITGSTELFSTFLETFSRLRDFSDLWHSLLEYFVSYLDCESYELTKSIFRSLATTFEATEDTKNLKTPLVNEVASLWARDIPQGSVSVGNGHECKSEAFVAYVDVGKQIYRLLESEISSKHSEIIIDRLQNCVEASTAIPYSKDLDSMTQLQSEVLGFLKRMRLDLERVTSKIVYCLARFIVIPYDRVDDARDGNALTFVAFAKSSIDMVSHLIATHGNKSEIYSSSATASALESLARSIELQYNWQRQGKEPSLWRKATESSITIVKTILPAIRPLKLPEAITQSLWNRIIQILSAIHNTTDTTQTTDSILLPDESFDLTSSATLRDFITPFLSADTLPASIRTSYVASLTRSSIAHNSRFDPLPALQPSQPAAHLLCKLHTVRMGRTYDPPFNPRIRISYACLDELFSLAGVTQSTYTISEHATNGSTRSTNSLLLAKTALPFLIARCALPLKSFIADQPLRGRMPTPTSQRLELLYILKQVRELRCPAEAFEQLEREIADLDEEDMGEEGSAARGMPKTGFRVLDPRRRHLEMIVPLVSRAIVCAGRDDGEMKMEMQRVLDVVSEGR